FDGAPYLVSELLAGETLRDRLHERLPLDTTLAYAAQIASGLAAAHEKGIVHRDLKPENLFVTSDGRIKIIDFGVAKLLPAAGVLPPRHGGNPGAAVLKTLSGAVLGTVGYMSPEQRCGRDSHCAAASRPRSRSSSSPSERARRGRHASLRTEKRSCTARRGMANQPSRIRPFRGIPSRARSISPPRGYSPYRERVSSHSRSMSRPTSPTTCAAERSPALP